MTDLFDSDEVEETSEGVSQEAEEVTESIIEDESQESEEESEEESSEETAQEEVVYEIDGEEVSSEDLSKWKESFKREQENGSLQNDYAKLSEEVQGKAQKLDDSLAVIEAAESELKSLLLSDLEDVDLKQLKESDFQEYQRVKEDISEREAKIEAIKQKFANARKEMVSEQSQNLSELRGWKTEEKRTQDLALLNDFAKANGFEPEDLKVLTRAKVVDALIKFAALEKQMTDKSKSRRKVIKPTVVKSNAKSTTKKVDSDLLFSD